MKRLLLALAIGVGGLTVTAPTATAGGSGTFTPPIHACEGPWPHLGGTWIVMPDGPDFCAENVGRKRQRACADHEHYHHGYTWTTANNFCHVQD